MKKGQQGCVVRLSMGLKFKCTEHIVLVHIKYTRSSIGRYAGVPAAWGPSDGKRINSAVCRCDRVARHVCKGEFCLIIKTIFEVRNENAAVKADVDAEGNRFCV